MSSEENYDLDFSLEDLIPRLEELRTLIVYDSQYIVRAFIFGRVIPHFSSKDLYLVVYSDTMMRRLAKTYETLPDESIRKILDGVKVIKIGQNDSVPFGKLHLFINIRGDWWDDLALALSDLGESFVLFHGFSLLPLIYGSLAWKFFVEISDSLPDDVTLVNKISSSIYEGEMRKVLERVHDVIIRIKWEEEFFPVGRTCWIGVEQSIVFDVKPGYARFRLSGGGRERISRRFEDCKVNFSKFDLLEKRKISLIKINKILY